MFRPFGTSTTSPAGSNPNPFGAPATTAPTTGFGTGAFGSSTTTGTAGIFGSTAPVAAQPVVGFGGGNVGFGGMPSAQMSVGTGNPSYTSTTDQESNMTIHLYCISAMPAYRGKSLEELRLEDYQAGKKTASAFPGTVTSGTFGNTAAPATTGSIFGIGSSTTTSPFSQSGFGAKPFTPGGFGTNTAPSTMSGGFGASPFGTTPAATTATPGFGQPATAAPSTSFGFGTQQQQSQQQTSPFGQSAFGQNQPAAPSFGFGTTPTVPAAPVTSGFGTPGTSTTGFGIGQTNSPFGAPKPTPSFGFGNTAAPAQPAGSTTGIFGFGTSQPATSSPFTFNAGATPSATMPAQNTPSFNFGNAPAAAAPGTGLFSASTGAAPAAGAFTFPSTSTNLGASGGLFGNKPAAPATTGFNFGNLGGTTVGASTSSTPPGFSLGTGIRAGWPRRFCKKYGHCRLAFFRFWTCF